MRVVERFSLYDVWGLAHGEGDDRPPGFALHGWVLKDAGRWKPWQPDRNHVSMPLRLCVQGVYTSTTNWTHFQILKWSSCCEASRR